MQAEILSIMHAEKSADTVRLDFRQKPRPGAIDFFKRPVILHCQMTPQE